MCQCESIPRCVASSHHLSVLQLCVCVDPLKRKPCNVVFAVEIASVECHLFLLCVLFSMFSLSTEFAFKLVICVLIPLWLVYIFAV